MQYLYDLQVIVAIDVYQQVKVKYIDVCGRNIKSEKVVVDPSAIKLAFFIALSVVFEGLLTILTISVDRH